MLAVLLVASRRLQGGRLTMRMASLRLSLAISCLRAALLLLDHAGCAVAALHVHHALDLAVTASKDRKRSSIWAAKVKPRLNHRENIIYTDAERVNYECSI